MIKFGRAVTVNIGARLPPLVERLSEDDRIDAVWLYGSHARNELGDVEAFVAAIVARYVPEAER